MIKYLVGAGLTGIASAGVAFHHFTKHVDAVAVVSPADAPGLQRFLEHPRPLHVDVCQVTISSNVSVRQFARAFFTSPVFCVERRILQAAGQGQTLSNEEINRMKFEVGDKVATFDVVDCQHSSTTGTSSKSASDEILMCWDPELLGHSWLQTKPSPDVPGGTLVSFGSVLDLEQGGSIARLLLPLHLMYAKVVLASAERQVLTTESAET